MRNLAIAAVAALMIPAMAPAEEQKSQKDPNEIVCKKKAKTGTRFPTKICHTRAEWEQIYEAGRRDAKELLDQPVINTDKDG